MARNTDLALIVAAVGARRLGASSALRWARRSQRGENISIISQLAPVAPKMSEQAITALADQLVTIFASGSRDAGTAVPGELDDAAADLLFPPRRWDEIERRDEALAAAAPRLGDYTLEELHRELFGDSVIESNRGADAAAAPGHVQFFGRHIHEHAAYDGHAGRHTHSHTHEGDGSHDHAHP